MHFKMSSAKWRSFCPERDELMTTSREICPPSFLSCALFLCIIGRFYPYPSAFLRWHHVVIQLPPVSMKRPWWTWVDKACIYSKNDDIITTQQSMRELWAYALKNTVFFEWQRIINMYKINVNHTSAPNIQGLSMIRKRVGAATWSMKGEAKRVIVSCFLVYAILRFWSVPTKYCFQSSKYVGMWFKEAVLYAPAKVSRSWLTLIPWRNSSSWETSYIQCI